MAVARGQDPPSTRPALDLAAAAPKGTTFSDRSLEDFADACASSRLASLPPSRTRIGPVVGLVLGLENATQAADRIRRQQAAGTIVAHLP